MTPDATWLGRVWALDPGAVGGVWLRGPAGEARDAWLQALRAAWPADSPWRRLPLHTDDEGLFGGIDLAASLAQGRTVRHGGLLAQAAGGVLLLPMAERASLGLAARLGLALERGQALLALDEGRDDDAPIAPTLAERLGLVLTVREAPAQPALAWTAPERQAARQRLAALPFDADTVQALGDVAWQLGLRSMRPVWQAWRLACASAALAERAAVSEDDVTAAARWVLAPRARALPSAKDAAPQNNDVERAAAPAPAQKPPPAAHAAPPPPDASDRAPGPAEPSAPAADEPRPSPPQDAAQPPAEVLRQAVLAALPAGLLAQLAAQAGRSPRRAAGGRQGAGCVGLRGRRLPAHSGVPRGGARLDLLATWRAALPWQGLRQQARLAAGGLPRTGLLVERSDLHIQRRISPSPMTTVFVVDASGSQAHQRLAEAKGAVELLLADCYVRRDQVALLAFRGTQAELLLPPTRSLVRTKRALSELPGGGGTPLAQGIAAATELAMQLVRRGQGRVQLVFLTDGRANIGRDGQAGREAAQADATRAAQQLAATGVPALLIDTAVRPQAAARALAQAMAARYVALPLGAAGALSAAVSAARPLG